MNNKNLLFGFYAAFVLGIAMIFASFVGVKSVDLFQKSFSKTNVPTSQSVYSPSGISLDKSVFIGPSNLGGRVRALLVDKNNPNIVFAGFCGGGLWKSSTTGTSWTAVGGISQNLIVTSITQSPSGDIYVGTGEGITVNVADMIGYKGFIGKGVFKSGDGGNTFTQLSSTIPGNGNDPRAAWAYVNDLFYDQTSNKIYAATNRGVRVSGDGGSSWTNPIPSMDTTVIQVSCGGSTVVVGFINKCFVSSDGGNTFVDRSTGDADKLPSTGVSGMSVAVAPSNSNFIYASLAKTDGLLFNVYRSVDAGNTWAIIGPGNTNTFSPLGNHGLYNNIISVFPNNENKIIVAGQNIWMWDNGGNWLQKTVSNNGYQYHPTYYMYYVPVSQHRIAFNPNNNNIFYVASDGGVSKTIDGGETYKLMYIGLGTSSFYSVAMGYGDFIIGGTQGSGTIGIQTGHYALPKPQSTYGFTLLNTACGGNVAASYIVNNKATFFASVFDAGIKRSPDMNFNWVDFPTSRVGTPRYHSLIPFSYWESLNDYETTDTIPFINNQKKTYLKNGDGNTKLYLDTIIPDQTSAKIVPGSILISTGSQTVVDDSNGKLRSQNSTGQELGTISYTTGILNFSFVYAPGYGSIVELYYKVRYNNGDFINVKSYIDGYLFSYKLTTNVEPLQTIYVKDIVQSKLFLGTSNAVWVTRKALDFTKPPYWFNIAKFTDATDTIKCISNSKSGDAMFYGTKKGKLFSASNLLHAHDSLTGDTLSSQSVVVQKDLTLILNQVGRFITSIAIDPSDANHIVVTLGNYNYSNYIYESRNALGSSPTFMLKQGNLPPMPVYSAIIEMGHPNLVILGTENGVYATEDISASSPDWVDQSIIAGIPHVPVFSIKQQIYDFPKANYTILGDTVLNERHDTIVHSYGKILIGTFGRGIYANNTFKRPNEVIKVPLSGLTVEKILNGPINIFPNPATNQTSLQFNLTEKTNTEIIVIDIQGRIVKKISLSNAEGLQNISIDCNTLKNGTYYVNVIAGDKKMVGKFVVIK
jgi:hypothetical protein